MKQWRRSSLAFSLLCLCMLFPFSPPAAAQDGKRLESTIVRVLVSKRQVDPTTPWQYEEVQQQAHLGVALDSGRILTTAFAIADATFLEAQKFGSTRKAELSVAFVDYEVNLALLEPAAGAESFPLKGAALGDDLTLNDSVDIYRARDAFNMARMQASLQEVGVYAAVTSSYSMASYLLKVQQTGLGWSEPIFQGDRLVGIATGQDANFVYATPMTIIRHFLDDAHTPEAYKGFPSIGIELASLTSPNMRKLVKASGVEGGVRVARVEPRGEVARLLREDDVIIEANGIALSEQGTFEHPKWGKVPLKVLLNQLSAGDVMKLKILRGGTEMVVEGKLERFDSNASPVVAYRFGQPEPHVIFGGLIFQELSRAYLRQWGREWEDVAPLELLYIYNFEDKDTAAAGREEGGSQRVIFLTRVLADDFNRGYGSLRNEIVTTVNGQIVTSMTSLRAALAKPVVSGGRSFARIQFAREAGEVILAYDGIEAAHRRITKAYEVPTPASFYQATAR